MGWTPANTLRIVSTLSSTSLSKLPCLGPRSTPCCGETFHSYPTGKGLNLDGNIQDSRRIVQLRGCNKPRARRLGSRCFFGRDRRDRSISSRSLGLASSNDYQLRHKLGCEGREASFDILEQSSSEFWWCCQPNHPCRTKQRGSDDSR